MIEAENLKIGGLVDMQNKYRLKHISTGKYLTIKDRKNEKPKPAKSQKTLEVHKINLGNIDDPNTL